MASVAAGILGGSLLSGLFGGDKEEKKEETPLVRPSIDDPVARTARRKKQAKLSKQGGQQSTVLGDSFSRSTIG